MSLRDKWSDWRESRDRAWWDRYDSQHRWDLLAKYNSERARGIVHTAEWDAVMAQEQRAFNDEHHYGHETGFPIQLEPES